MTWKTHQVKVSFINGRIKLENLAGAATSELQKTLDSLHVVAEPQDTIEWDGPRNVDMSVEFPEGCPFCTNLVRAANGRIRAQVMPEAPEGKYKYNLIINQPEILQTTILDPFVIIRRQ